MNTSNISMEQVLESFAMERDHGAPTLERYLREYPSYSAELIDLSQEIFRLGVQDEGALPLVDQVRIDSAWSKFQSFLPSTTDVVGQMSVSKQRELSVALGVPRQVVSAFRERRVRLDSVPRTFLSKMAAILATNVDDLLGFLSAPQHALARSYKADEKPETGDQTTFEKLLRDAKMADEQIKRLLADKL